MVVQVKEVLLLANVNCENAQVSVVHGAIEPVVKWFEL
jgi:hypothetical protein